MLQITILYKVLGKCFTGYIYGNIVQYCTWYNHSIRMRYNAYRHTGSCILSACFISRSAIFSRSGPHGRGDWLAPFSAPCASLSTSFKRTATITQVGAGSQTLLSGTVFLNLLRCAINVVYIFASIKAIAETFLI